MGTKLIGDWLRSRLKGHPNRVFIAARDVDTDRTYYPLTFREILPENLHQVPGITSVTDPVRTSEFTRRGSRKPLLFYLNPAVIMPKNIDRFLQVKMYEEYPIVRASRGFMPHGVYEQRVNIARRLPNTVNPEM